MFWSGSSATTSRATFTSMTAKNRLMGRLDVDRMVGVEGWMPDRKLIKLIAELKDEGRL